MMPTVVPSSPIKQNFRGEARVRALAKDIHEGKCILFIGAGLSQEAGLPSWQQLEDKMKRDAELQGSYGALRTADCCLEALGAPRFHELLNKLFKIHTEPTPLHRRLARLPVNIYVTTNYDNLIEQALRDEQRHATVLLNTNRELWPFVDTRGDTAWVLKIHGTVEAFPHGLVIGERDYLKFADEYPHVTHALSTLFSRHSVLFIGYSLSDPNVAQILFQVTRLTEGFSTNRYFVAVGAEGPIVQLFESKTAYGLRVLNVRDSGSLLDLFDEITAEYTVPDWFIAQLHSLNCFVDKNTLRMDTPLAAISTAADSTIMIRLALRIEAERGVKLPLERVANPNLDVGGFLRLVDQCTGNAG